MFCGLSLLLSRECNGPYRGQRDSLFIRRLPDNPGELAQMHCTNFSEQTAKGTNRNPSIRRIMLRIDLQVMEVSGLGVGVSFLRLFLYFCLLFRSVFFSRSAFVWPQRQINYSNAQCDWILNLFFCTRCKHFFQLLCVKPQNRPASWLALGHFSLSSTR